MPTPVAPRYVDTNDAATVKQWSALLDTQLGHENVLLDGGLGLSGSNPYEYAIHQSNELGAGKGDRIRNTRYHLTGGDGTTEDDDLEGNEVGLSHSTSDTLIGYLKHGIKLEIPNTSQRLAHDDMKAAKTNLKLWAEQRQEVSHLVQACHWNLPGQSNYRSSAGDMIDGTDGRWRGFNPIATLDAAHHLWADPGNNTDAATLTSPTDDIFKGNLIGYAAYVAKSLQNPIAEVNVRGTRAYVMFLHTRAMWDLRNAESGRWWEIMKNSLAGGHVNDNPLVTRSNGIIDGVIINESRFLSPAINNAGAAVANTRRAVLLGAGAMRCAYAKGYDGLRIRFAFNDKDYGDKKGVAVKMFYGVSVIQHTRESGGTLENQGSLVLDHYASDDSQFGA